MSREIEWGSLFLGLALGWILYALCMPTYYAKHIKLQEDVIDRGYAEWSTDVNGSKVLMWKEQK
jgi:hypothetical protein